MIALRIRHSTAPRRLTVVSSDQKILRAARKRRCQTLTSEQFLHHLAHDAGGAPGAARRPADSSRGAPGGLSEKQVQAWLSIFGVDPAAAEPPPEVARDRPAAGDSKQEQQPSATDEPPTQSGPVIPEDLIREAEKLWSEQDR